MNHLNAVTMTAAEAELITAYRLSDARGKQAIMDYARGMSEDWPEPRRAELDALMSTHEPTCAEAPNDKR